MARSYSYIGTRQGGVGRGPTKFQRRRELHTVMRTPLTQAVEQLTAARGGRHPVSR
jgi:hypothetical protein